MGLDDIDIPNHKSCSLEPAEKRFDDPLLLTLQGQVMQSPAKVNASKDTWYESYDEKIDTLNTKTIGLFAFLKFRLFWGSPSASLKILANGLNFGERQILAETGSHLFSLSDDRIGT